MIEVTRLDGEKVFINERNIQWVESLPDTAITFLGGARLIVREKMGELMGKLERNESVAGAGVTPAPATDPLFTKEKSLL